MKSSEGAIGLVNLRALGCVRRPKKTGAMFLLLGASGIVRFWSWQESFCTGSFLHRERTFWFYFSSVLYFHCFHPPCLCSGLLLYIRNVITTLFISCVLFFVPACMVYMIPFFPPAPFLVLHFACCAFPTAFVFFADVSLCYIISFPFMFVCQPE